jgi:hypothetical protein
LIDFFSLDVVVAFPIEFFLSGFVFCVGFYNQDVLRSLLVVVVDWEPQPLMFYGSFSS